MFLQIEFVRFLLVGCGNTLISYLIFIGAFAFLPNIMLKATVAQIFSYLGGVGWSFFWNSRWTFKQKESGGYVFLKFFILQITLLGLSSVLIGFFVDYKKMPATLVWLFVMAVITIFNYMGSRHFIFNK